jgi:hypothetical protein
MDQVLGRIQIEEIAPQTGLKPLLRINVTLISKYDSAFDLMTVNSKVEILFSEKGRVVPDIPTNYVGEALVEWRSRTVAPGDGSSITLHLPVDFELLGGIEEIRQGHDVEVKLWITFNGIERQTPGTIGQRVVAGEIMDARYNSQGVSATIAKSKWMEFLNEWQYSPSQKNAAKELSKTILEAQQAKREAEEAAKAAKEAAQLTAVTSLSQAYVDEARVLGNRSWVWAVISLLVAIAGAYSMVFYVRQSMSDKFTLPEAVIRGAVLAVIFGAFTLCLRIYEAYRHLEVVNRHRVNIGRTFEAFKAAQPTDRAKEIMAAITAENMLAFGKSGFAGKDSPNQGPLAGASDLIKAILEKQGH